MKKNNQSLEKMRHSCEHVLHQAMTELFPGLKRAMGPATDEGFYHDFDYNGKVNADDFPKIEKRMQEIIKANLPIVRQQISIGQARKLFKNNPYKQEWLDEIEERGEKATVYWTGDPNKTGSDVDLCKGPHVKSTGEIGPFKLLSIAGAYWHGNEKNKMLTRIYGTCFSTKKELDKYLWQLKEAKKRDHRILGKKLDLFSFHPESPGNVFRHPKGFNLIQALFDYWRKVHQEKGYVEIRTPVLLTKKTWDKSGHTSFFIDKMYKVISPDSKKWNYAVKPMNCDGGIMVYKNKPRSYKEFPLRMGEIGVVHRHEASGELHGIMRPREFTQDDAHIYCTPAQVKSELKAVIDLCFEIYNTFSLKLDHLELSTRPEKSIGSDQVWKEAEKIMKQVLKEKKVPHQINEGDGAFYGPKFDFHLKDNMGRTWQCATIQLDFAQPENFNLEYITAKGNKKKPVMIHRTVYGSIERFLGILIEHFAGAFPVWLAPTQVIIIPITDKNLKHAQEIAKKLRDENLRVEIDSRSETMQKKIKEAEEQKIPYMLILGKKEEKENKVSVRQRGQTCLAVDRKEFGQMTFEKFLGKIQREIKDKK